MQQTCYNHRVTAQIKSKTWKSVIKLLWQMHNLTPNVSARKIRFFSASGFYLELVSGIQWVKHLCIVRCVTSILKVIVEYNS